LGNPEPKISESWPVPERLGVRDPVPRDNRFESWLLRRFRPRDRPPPARRRPDRPRRGENAAAGLLRRRWLPLTAGALVAAGIVGFFTLRAASYQPLAYGSDEALGFPGLPSGKGLRVVNNLGGYHEDIYIPPQRGTFSLFVDILNSGSRTVTIEAVRFPLGTELFPTGPERYARPDWWGGPRVSFPSRIFHPVALAPGQEIYIGIPVRTSPCAEPDSWEGVPSFYVTYRWLFFTHTTAIPWGMGGDELIMHMPTGCPRSTPTR
jgi:hypothetical protein